MTTVPSPSRSSHPQLCLHTRPTRAPGTAVVRRPTRLPYGKESANRNSQESFEGMSSADSDFVPLILGLLGAPASRCHRQLLNQFGGRGIANNCGVIAWNISAAPSLS